MRIVHILEFNQFNTGSVHQMFQAAAGLRARGHDVTVVSRPDALLERRCREHDVVFTGMPLRNQFDLHSMRALSRLIGPRDVVHVHKGVSHALALAATWLHPPGAFVVNRGVSFPLDFWNRGKFRTRRVDRIVTVCEQIRGVVIASGKLPPDKVTVVYAGTDVQRFDPARWPRDPFRRELAVPEDAFLIGQAGVRDWKGWKELVDAAAEFSHAHVALIGCRDERERAAVRDYARSRGTSGRVTSVEVRDDMPNVFAACDLVVDASWAGTGITGTIREAMAMEKPVIATDCGGNAELVSSPEVGWLIPKRNHAALTRAIGEVIADPVRAAGVGRQARVHVVRSFSMEIRIDKLERLYGEILTAHGAG
jgi:glycosyltransferase involved in cell wall biosynthesis